MPPESFKEIVSQAYLNASNHPNVVRIFFYSMLIDMGVGFVIGVVFTTMFL